MENKSKQMKYYETKKEEINLKRRLEYSVKIGKLKPEEKAEIILYNWLRPKVKEIYFNRKNIINAPTFKTKSETREIPDLIIATKEGQYIVVEVKPSKDTYKVTEGKYQLIDQYFKPYLENKLKFYIEDKEIDISSFVLATDLASQGRLCRPSTKEVLLDNIEDELERNKIACVLDYKTMPRYEYKCDHDLVRDMFKNTNQYLKKNKGNVVNFTGIGVLYADYKTKVPMIYVKKKINNRWGQHYWRL